MATKMPQTFDDYILVEVPEGKDPTEYTTLERRAEILDMMIQRGHPYGMKQTDLAKRYGITQSSIHDDLMILKAYLGNDIGEYTKSLTQTAFQNVFRGFMDDLDKEDLKLEQKVALRRSVWATLMEWNNFLMKTGDLRRQPDELIIRSDISTLPLKELGELYNGIKDEDEEE